MPQPQPIRRLLHVGRPAWAFAVLFMAASLVPPSFRPALAQDAASPSPPAPSADPLLPDAPKPDSPKSGEPQPDLPKPDQPDPKPDPPKPEPKPEPKPDKPELDPKPPAVEVPKINPQAGESTGGDYGFLPIEIFKLTQRIANLSAADFNNDGLQDLVVVDNGEMRVDLLLSRAKAGDKVDLQKNEVNDVKDSWRFEHVKIPLLRKLDALIPADFNGDGRVDLCGIGDNHLVVLLANEKGAWDQPRERRLSDQLLPIPWQIDAGDVDDDGCVDLVTLGDSETLIFRGAPDGSLTKLERLPNASNRFTNLWLRDLTGNKRLDLLFLASDDALRSMVVRFQDPTRGFGPEFRLDLPSPRAVEVGDVDGKPGDEIAAVDSKTGRVKMYKVLQQDPAFDSPTSPLVQFGFGPQTGSALSGHQLAVGDVNGDGLMDVVTVNGGAALMTVYLQDFRHGLGKPLSFPGLTGIRSVCLADADNDGLAEVFLASEREKAVAVSRWKDGRLTFPQALPTVDSPMALCVADFDGSGKKDLAYVAAGRESGLPSYSLRRLTYRAEQGWQAGDFNGVDAIPLDQLRSAPSELISVDADRDGRSDLMAISNNAPMVFLLTNGRGVPQQTEANLSSRLGNLSPGRVTIGQLEGEAILVADKNFTRRVKYDPRTAWRVVDQFNAETPEASIAGTAIVDLDGDRRAEIVLVDVGAKRLRFLKKTDSVYRPWKDLDIGSFNYQSLAVGDFNHDGRDDLLLFAPDRFGVVYVGLAGPALVPIGGYESQLRDVKLSDLAIGDVGGEAEIELSLIDMGKQRLEIIAPRAGDWKSVLEFKLFETPQPGLAGREPREILISDVTGDGLKDLIMVVRDRILLFPQDPGPDNPGPQPDAVK